MQVSKEELCDTVKKLQFLNFIKEEMINASDDIRIGFNLVFDDIENKLLEFVEVDIKVA